MIFYIACDIPEPKPKALNAASEHLTTEEGRILKEQISKNRVMIDHYLKRIDLFVNQEKYPHGEKFIEKLRQKMFLLMEESDTFRKVLWRYFQQESIGAGTS